MGYLIGKCQNSKQHVYLHCQMSQAVVMIATLQNGKGKHHSRYNWIVVERAINKEIYF